MTKTQELNLRMSEARSKLNDAIKKRNESGEMTDELKLEMRAATDELEGLEIEYRAALMVEADAEKRIKDLDEGEDAEAREFRKVEERSKFSNYVVAALESRSVDGAEKELNEALNMSANYFPLSMLAGDVEERAKIDGETSVKPRTWLDRVFHNTAAARLGISFPSVAPGVSSYPVTTGGGSGAQRGRTEATADGTFTFSVTELSPTRNSLSMTYSIEDDARVPGLADAIQRDMRAALVESIDEAIFNGDSGADENGADITGLKTASISESELTQANKVKGDEVLETFGNLVDGKYAESVADLRIVASIPAYKLWLKTIHNSSADNQTINQFLRASGVSYSTRADIDDATTNGKMGAYVALSRGLSGAAVAPVWMGAKMIRDVYTGAKKGEVSLVLQYLWNFGIPRTDNFKRVKFVSN